MDHNEHKPFESSSYESSKNATPQSGRWMLPVIIALVAIAALGVGYGFHQSGLVSDMATRLNQSNADAAQMRAQMDSLSAKLSDVLNTQQQQQAREQAASQPAAANSVPAPTARKGRAAASSKQLNQLRAQLSEQQKQLNDTRDALDKTRTDLETSLSTTRDDLNGSIARTHDELVTLAKRGERSYFEFDLTKHGGYEHSGPISVSLRKADTKHQRFDLNLIVDDAQLSKKSVNLYEPIWIHRADDPQPVQIVINKITKDHVHGYVSSPKYRQSELTAISYTSPANPSSSNNNAPPASAAPSAQQGAPPSSTPPNPNRPPGDVPPNQ